MTTKGGSPARSGATQQTAPVAATAQPATPTYPGTPRTAASAPVHPAVDRPTAAPAGWSSRSRTSRATHLVLPLVGAVVLGGGALAYEAQRSPQYTSEALVAVLPEDPADEVSLPITSIWAEIADSDSVRDRISRTLDVSRADLEDDLVIAASEDAPLVSVQATTGDAETSAEWANVAADEVLGEAQGNPVPGYDLDQVTDARPQGEADRFPTVPLVGGAAVVGLLAGAGAAQLVDRRARRRTQPAPAS